MTMDWYRMMNFTSRLLISLSTISFVCSIIFVILLLMYSLFADVDRDLNLYTQRYVITPSYVDSNGLPRYDTASLFDFFYSDPLPFSLYVANFRAGYGIGGTPSTTENATYASLSFGEDGDQVKSIYSISFCFIDWLC